MWQTLFSKVGHNSISQLMCSATYYQSVIRRWHLSTSLNLGKAFEFLDQETMVEVLCLVAQLCLTLCDPLDYSPSGSSVHGDSPGKNTGVGCHALLPWNFPTWESNPGLPHCRWILYCLSHKGSPGILEWVAYPFSSTSSRTGNQTGVSCTAGGFFFFNQLSYQGAWEE